MKHQDAYRIFNHVFRFGFLGAAGLLACACVETRVVGQPNVDAGPCESGCAEGTVCNTEANACVQCLGNDHCVGNANGGVCNTASHQCVQCIANTDCTTAEASVCNVESHQCVPCTESANCSHLGNKVCDTSNALAHKCVECTATERDGCNGKVCDANTKTCSMSAPNTAGLCRPCVSDAQCTSGKVCAPMKFGDPELLVGYFCLWLRDAVGTGAPAGACDNVRPYVSPKSVVSIDNVTENVCSLRTATCQAYDDFDQNCSSTAGDGGTIPDNTKCGATGFDDGVCVVNSGGGSPYKCTVPCISSIDCKSSLICTDDSCGPP